MKILQFPLTRIAGSFVPGIIAAAYLPIRINLLIAILAILFAAFCITWFLAKRDFLQKVYFGIAVYCVSFCTGMLTVTAHNGYLQGSNYIHQIHPAQKQVLEITLRERLKSTILNQRYIALVKKVDGAKSSGRILVHFRKNRNPKAFPIGTTIQLSTVIYNHKKPYNPDQFDYGQYLTNKSVYAQIYSNDSEILLGNHMAKDIYYYSDLLRNRIISNLSKQIAQRELHVIAALILGQQQDLSPDIVQDYQFAGAVHILSVSGLHVGFILLFINFLLRYFPNDKWTLRLKLAAVCMSLWSFAVIAGLSPSVVRSVTMFSFVAVGMHLKRKTNIFHTLLVSILLILLFEPSFLYDVGFQLSYAALFFILWLQPMLAEIWSPKNKIVNYFWQILTVSFAAQVGALPLSIYYFHQFPGLFFITNLIIIPFLSFIMALGCLVIIVAALGFVPHLPAQILEWTIIALNIIIKRIASFDAFIFRDIPFNQMMMLTCYCVILATILFFAKRNFKRLTFVLISLVVFQITFIATRWIGQKQMELIVFNSKRATLIVARKGEELIVFGNSASTNNQALKSYAVANFCQIATYSPLQNTLWFSGKKILIIDSLGQYPQENHPDIILIRQSPKLNLDRMLKKLHPETIVADASNYKSYVAMWKSTCDKRKIPFHAVHEKGFYKLE